MAPAAPLDGFGEQRPAGPSQRGFVPLWRGKGKLRYTFLLTSPKIFGVLTHWNGERVLPCTAAMGACLPCRNGWEARWRGFLSGLSCLTKGQYLLPISDLAWRECVELRELDGQLRGRTFGVGRIGEKSNAPWKWDYACFPALEPPRPAVNLAEQLGRLWGINLVELAAKKRFNGDVRPLLKPFKRRKGGKDQ